MTDSETNDVPAYNTPLWWANQVVGSLLCAQYLRDQGSKDELEWVSNASEDAAFYLKAIGRSAHDLFCPVRDWDEANGACATGEDVVCEECGEPVAAGERVWEDDAAYHRRCRTCRMPNCKSMDAQGGDTYDGFCADCADEIEAAFESSDQEDDWDTFVEAFIAEREREST